MDLAGSKCQLVRITIGDPGEAGTKSTGHGNAGELVTTGASTRDEGGSSSRDGLGLLKRRSDLGAHLTAPVFLHEKRRQIASLVVGDRILRHLRAGLRLMGILQEAEEPAPPHL